ncbi:hypothetical protein N825_16120 [Skermanella stibiiresistens SB22]|uniref:Uncharacterized protein n=1 Tax=Skermanella stibiiresistens SB22 TaxID=1385369 RepID=W9H2D6_9PROT|nr:hypothetical protein N825_16120 [Skermanella stibiiresistens SB22]
MTSYLSGTVDITLLRGFIATAQQQVYGFSSTCEVDPVSGASVNAHFAHAFADRFAISEISGLGIGQSPQDTGASLTIFEAG